MRYQDGVEKSAEYLRLALPYMSKQAAALHPLSYAVWYEYVSGQNARLKQAVDALTQNGRVLDEAATRSIHAQHIAELDEQSAKRVAAGFQRVLADISKSASDAGDQASRFGSTLEQWSEGLSQPQADAIAQSGIDQLIRGTREMQGAISSLQGRLDESRSEIERLREEVQRAREDAMLDALSGLTNRRGFDLALAKCIADGEASGAGPSLLIADIDHFKLVNDQYGHLFGDKVIRAVAQILRQNIKGKDTAARFGGEEFVILLPDTPLAGARALAENIRTTVERSRIRRADNQQEMARITVSFGVASYRPGESAAEFISRVDSALYASKHRGRNRVTLAGNESSGSKKATASAS